MKIFAQHGYGEGDKILNGLRQKLIHGIIFSPRDVTPDKLEYKLNEYQLINDVELLLDPQYYTCLIGSNPNVNIGKLEQYPFFKFETKSKLEEERNINKILKNSLEFQDTLSLTSIISPNILISNSFDSRDAVIAKNFIRLSFQNYHPKSLKKPLICTLAVSKDALTNLNELQEFLNEITILEEPPDGFYILIAFRSSESRAEVFNSDVLAAWMLINYSLKVNGFKVINGYSDLISPLLSCVGADVACTGWWSNLRMFSIDKFMPLSSGGRLPIQRYLSKNLFNRITYYELDALKKLVPDILNNLSTDKYYLEGEPDRSIEILQTWEVLNLLCDELSKNTIIKNLNYFQTLIDKALSIYSKISAYIPLDTKSNSEHLEPLNYAITKFKSLAEL